MLARDFNFTPTITTITETGVPRRKRAFVQVDNIHDPQPQPPKKKDPESTRSYKAIYAYLKENAWLCDHPTVLDAMLDWLGNVVGKVTLRQVRTNLVDIYKLTNGDPELILRSINEAIGKGWFKFYMPTKRSYSNRNTGQALADAHGGGVLDYEKDYDDGEGVDY